MQEQSEPYVEPFLELVKQMYANTRAVVEKTFGAPGVKPAPPPRPPTPPPVTPAADGTPAIVTHAAPPVILSRALHSPKVLTECPIAIVLIFQTYKQVQQPALLDFYPLVMESIKIQPEPQRVAHLEERGEIFVGIASGITNREVYTDLIKAQVKVRPPGSKLTLDHGLSSICFTRTPTQHQRVSRNLP
jgi:transformation/transcription domain-associated protein